MVFKLGGDLRRVTKELTVSSRNQAPGAAPLVTGAGGDTLDLEFGGGLPGNRVAEVRVE